MKICIISISLLYYITFLHQWNFVESQSANGTTSGARGTQSGGTTGTSQQGRSSQQFSSSTPTAPTKITPITLNINKTSSTTEFDYSKDGDYVTYTPKSSYVFSKIVKKPLIGSTTVIWQSTNNVYGTLVNVKSVNKDVHLAILLLDNSFVLFHSSDSGNKWSNLTSDRPDPSKLRFLTNYNVELSTTDFSVNMANLSFQYKFNTGVNCRKITYSNVPLWSHTDDTNYSSIKSLSLDVTTNKFFVTNTSDESKVLIFKPTPVTQATPITLDLQNTDTTNVFQYTDRNSVTTYKPNSNNVFSKVTDGTTTVFQSTNNVHATMVKSMSINNIKYLAILLTDNTFTVFHLTDGSGDSYDMTTTIYDNMFTLLKESDSKWKDLTSTKYDLSKLIFLGENDTELTASQYTVTLHDLTYTFLFKDSVKCRAIMYSNRYLWKHTDDTKFSEIKSVSLDLPKDQLSVTNTKDESKELPKPSEPTTVTLNLNATESTNEYDFNDQSGLVTYKVKDNHVFSKVTEGPTDVWESKNNLYATVVRSMSVDNIKYVVLLMDNNTFKVFHLSGDFYDMTSTIYDSMFTVFNLVSGDWEDLTAKTLDPSKLKFLNDNDTPLKPSDYQVTLQNLSYTFLFKDGVNCQRITYNDNPLWKHTDDPKYSSIKSLSLNLLTNRFFVTNQSNQSKELELKLQLKATPLTQKTLDPSKLTKISLDIRKTKLEDTDKYSYTQDNLLITFKPNDGHVFNMVTYGPPPSSSTSSGSQSTTQSSSTQSQSSSTPDTQSSGSGTKTSNVIFQTTSTNNVLCTLAMVKSKDSKSVRNLALLLHDNTFLLFKEKTGWNEVTWENITSTILDVTKLKFLGEGDTELTQNDFEVTLTNLSYKYTFKDGVSCRKITYNDIQLWSPTDDTEFSSIKSLSLDLLLNKFFIKNSSNHSKELIFIPTPVTKSTSGQSTSTTEFSYSKDQDGVVTYTPKSDHLFTKVTDGIKDIWQSTTNVYGTLVVTNIYDVEKHLALLLTDNTIVLFHLDNNQWKDITKSIPDVTKLKFFGENDTPLKSSDYSVTLQDLTYTIKFNTDVTCQKITYSDNPVWNHTDDTNFSDIISLSLNLLTNSFLITNQSSNTKNLNFKPTTPTTTDELEIAFNDQGDLITYRPNYGYAYTKINQSGNLVWQSTNNRAILVKSMSVNRIRYVALLLTDDTFAILQVAGNWTNVTDQRYDLSNLILLGENDTELTASQYTVTLQNLSYTILFNTGVSCRKILHHDRYLWKHTDDTDFSDIKSLSLDLTTNSFIITNQSNQSKTLNPTNPKSQPGSSASQPVSQSTDSQSSSTRSDSQSSPSTNTQGSESQSDQSSTTESQPSESQSSTTESQPSESQSSTTESQPTPTESQSTEVTPVSLDIQNTQSTDHYDRTELVGFITYKPKSTNVFSKVSQGTKDIWESKDNVYATEVTLMSEDDQKSLLIEMTNSTVKLLTNNGGTWSS